MQGEGVQKEETPARQPASQEGVRLDTCVSQTSKHTTEGKDSLGLKCG